MTFLVTIIRNSDGARALHVERDTWGEGAAFRWTEGNEGCDCNRAALFAQVYDYPYPNPNPCGETEFSVILPVPTWSDHGYTDQPGRHLFRRRHAQSCGNQNVLDPDGAFKGVEECGCDKPTT